MSREPNPKIIGAFVVGAIALVVIIFVIFGSGRFFVQKNTYVIYFRSQVGGLNIGAPVKLRGVKIGEVTKVTALFDARGEFQVEVLIETDPTIVKNTGGFLEGATPLELVKALVKRGLRAQLNTQSLVLGQLYIKLDYFPDTPEIYTNFHTEFPEIPSILSKQEEFEITLKRTLANFDNIPIAEISNRLLSTLNGMDRLLRSSEVLATITSLDSTMQTAETMLSHFDSNIVRVSEAYMQTSEHLDNLLIKSNKTIERLENMAAEDRYELRLMLKDISEAARAMRELADYLERNPSSIIYGKD